MLMFEGVIKVGAIQMVRLSSETWKAKIYQVSEAIFAPPDSCSFLE